MSQAGWQRLEIDGKVYAWEGPLHEMTEGPPLIEPEGLITALSKAGLRCLPFYLDNRLQGHLKGLRELYLLDEFGRKRLVMNPWEQMWMVQPKNASRGGR